MRILLVEDDDSLVDQLLAALRQIDGGLEADIAQSRDTAYDFIQDQIYDLVVCDLKIPSVDRALDSLEQHGLAVVEHCTKESPGTPVLILSAFATPDIMQDLLRAARSMDPYGSREPITMVDLIQKKRLHEFIDRVGQFSKEIVALNEVAIDGNVDRPLLDEQERVLRVFARWHRGFTVDVQELGGGLSGSRTLRVQVFDGRHNTTALAVGKLGKIDKVENEEERCRAYVAPVISPGGFTPHMATVAAGAPHIGGLFYSLAAEYEWSLFDLLRNDVLGAAQAVREIREIEDPWLRDAPFREGSIKEIRRMCLDDEDLDVISQFIEEADREAFENRRIQIHICVQHADLHPGNVLVNNDGSPILIDFGRVGETSAVIDPVTLEMSILFHPMGEDIRKGWPNVDQAMQWTSMDSYLEGCPFSEFVIACREWAEEVSSSRREHMAAAYAFLMRQFKFGDTDHKLAAIMASHAINAFSAPLSP